MLLVTLRSIILLPGTQANPRKGHMKAKWGRRGTARRGAGGGMRYNLPRAPIRGAGRLLPVLEASVHAQEGVEEPRHGGKEGEGEDGAPDVAPAGAPRETPGPGVPQATAPATQLRAQLATCTLLFKAMDRRKGGQRTFVRRPKATIHMMNMAMSSGNDQKVNLKGMRRSRAKKMLMPERARA